LHAITITENLCLLRWQLRCHFSVKQCSAAFHTPLCWLMLFGFWCLFGFVSSTL
jgi:hypothetical protein